MGPSALPSFVTKAIEHCYDAKPGSKVQSLALFLKLRDFNDGARLYKLLDYSVFAEAWYKYGLKRFYVEGELAKGLSPFGKSVSRGIFIGKATRGDSFRTDQRQYPLHTCPCDICSFLVTLAKKQDNIDPFSTLRLKEIHEFFIDELKQYSVDPDFIDHDFDPTYECHSPAEESSSESEPVVPPAPRKKKTSRGAVVASTRKRLFGETQVVDPVAVVTTDVVTDSVRPSVVQRHTLGNFRW